jgi:hypothetical protein
MDFKIKKVILWPKKEALPRKEIELEVDKVNVIVGDSQTGKSAIIPIIDYCLASNKCTIPVGPIRKATAWFGVLVLIGETQLLLVRQEPGIHKSSSQMYFEEGKSIVIPNHIIESNRSADQVTNRLNQLCKLPSLDFAETISDKKPYESAASFKDFLAFCFQSQHIIANPYTLYHEADTIEHKLKLRVIFPLALGFVHANYLELQRRIAILSEQLKEKMGIMAEKTKIRDAWSAEIRGNYIRALELGILKDVPFPEETWKLADFILYLQRIPELAKEMKFPVLSDGVSSRVINYIAKLRQAENNILNDLEEKNYRLELLRTFKEGSSQYELAIANQQSRLEPINNGWLSAKISRNQLCPLCNSRDLVSKENLQKLIAAANSIGEKVMQINESKNILDREVTEIEKEILELEKQLNSTRVQLESLERQSDQIQHQRTTVKELFLYVGRIEQNLKNLAETNIDGHIAESISDLGRQIASLQGELTKAGNQRNRDTIIKRISQVIVFYKRILKVEDAENPTEIDEKQLTLKILSDDNREDYLWEIGSGSNWMGYHVSTLLALHEYFLELKNKNHIPSFIIFDQPSQAYFPDSKKLDENQTGVRSSDDLERVNAIFLAFSKFLKRSKAKCQIIVLEHASKEYWGNVDEVKQVGDKRWVKGDALIPEEWK